MISFQRLSNVDYMIHVFFRARFFLAEKYTDGIDTQLQSGQRQASS